MPNYLEYQKTIAAEFKAYENRVRYLIDNANWAEEGRYKEIILMNFLKRVLPNNLSVGTGFVRSNTDISKQIDVIIYEHNVPLFFSEGDFIVTSPENVIGIIEVKTRINRNNIKTFIEAANSNGKVISNNGNMGIFNGIFSFNCTNDAHNVFNKIKEIDMTEIIQNSNIGRENWLRTCVNHISLGENNFVKLWDNLYDGDFYSEYALYQLNGGLGVSYFISNLMEFVIRRKYNDFVNPLGDNFKKFYYPLEEGKEVYRLDTITYR